MNEDFSLDRGVSGASSKASGTKDPRRKAFRVGGGAQVGLGHSVQDRCLPMQILDVGCRIFGKFLNQPSKKEFSLKNLPFFC